VLGVHTDGGLQEALILPAHKLHPSTGLSFDQLALVETLAIGCHAVQRVRPTPDDDVLVVGAGPIGLAVMQFVRLTGASLTVLDLNAQRLDFCRNTLGIRDIIHHPGSADAAAKIFESRQNRGYSIVFDATGSPISMNQAPQYVAHSGSLIFVGIHKDSVSFPDPLFHSREMTLFASRNALPADFRQIIRQMQAGLIDTTPWITHRCNWLDIPANFETLTRPESQVVKAMIELD
jgi:alcohol dehydrogenase